MTDRPSHNLDGLDTDLARRIDEGCRRFEADWREGRQPRIDDYLVDVPDEGRAALRAELSALERELRQSDETAARPESGPPTTPEPRTAPTPSTIAEAPTIALGTPPTGPIPADAPSPVHEETTVPPGNPPRSPHDQPTAAVFGQDPSATPGAPEPTRIRYFGDYEILRELARGGMGVVFQARQVSLNRVVALKMILAGQLANEADVKRFYTEAEAAGSLDHPGIVPIFEVGKHEGQHFFSMGFVEGQSLSQRLADGPLPSREAAALMVKVAEAIEYAHRHGVIHRDLKPANILLDKNGNPRVTDFGLAKKVEGDSGLTGSGQIMGTPSYMPPEQAAGARGDVGPAADVYALGATLYALVTGRPPFQAATAMDTVIQVISDEPVPPRRLNPSISRDLETICLKCLEKEPARRYASAAALAEELARFLAGEPILARPIGGPERLWRWCRRRPVVAGLGSAVAALILFLTVAGPLVAVSQSRLRSVAEDRAIEARTAQNLAQSSQKAEAARRLEAEQAGYEATTKALAADQALVQSYLSEAENLRNLAQPGRQGRALELLKRASGLKHDTDSLAAKLGADSAGWRLAMTQFWREQRPRLRSEATRWFEESSLKVLYDTRFPIHMQSGNLYPITTSRSGLAQSDDGKWLAYFRSGFERMGSAPAKLVEIIEADTGKVVRSLKLGESYEQMNTLAFDARDQDVLVARVERDSRLRLVYLIERWSRVSGKVTATVSLPVAGSVPPDYSPHGGRLVFSADRKRLLSIPAEHGKKYDLRLVPSVKDERNAPTGGKDLINLIIVAAVDNVLHFRMFDGDGKLVVDTDEKRLTGQAGQIENLRNRLVGLWPPHQLTGFEKDQVIVVIASIIGHTYGKRATVWDLATAKPLREFEDDFTAEAFFPDARRIIGMTGSDVVVRDVTTGRVTKRWPMPDGLFSILGNARNNPDTRPGAESRLQPDAQSLWVSPDGRWVAAYGQRLRARHSEMPTTIFLCDAESGLVRAPIPMPDIQAGNRTEAPAPPLGFDAASRLLAVATTKSLSLFSVPQGTPLVSQALPESNRAPSMPPGQAAPMARSGVFTMPTGLLFARGTNRLFAAAHPWDLFGSPIGSSMGGLSDPARPVEQVVWSWDVTLPMTRALDHRHDGIVRAVKLDPRDRFVTAAGDDRMIRAWDRGGAFAGRSAIPGREACFPSSTRCLTSTRRGTAASSIPPVPCSSRGSSTGSTSGTRPAEGAGGHSRQPWQRAPTTGTWSSRRGEGRPPRASSGSSMCRGMPRSCPFPWNKTP
jgi:Protein kinase domain